MANQPWFISSTSRTGFVDPTTLTISAPGSSSGTAVAHNFTNGDDVGQNPYGAAGDAVYGTEGTSQPFGFHGSGINILFADGSVRFVDEGVDVKVFYNLVTRAGAEAVSNTNY